MELTFLSLADVVRIHGDQVERYGGQPGFLDPGLLQSAIAMPQASFGGEWLHRDLYEMAAAYAFHLSQNHPFVDGNKRTALACALVFLELNGVSLSDPKRLLYDAMMEVASGNLSKLDLGVVLRELPVDAE